MKAMKLTVGMEECTCSDEFIQEQKGIEEEMNELERRYAELKEADDLTGAQEELMDEIKERYVELKEELDEVGHEIGCDVVRVVELRERLGKNEGHKFMRALRAKGSISSTGKMDADIENLGDVYADWDEIVEEEILQPKLSDKDFRNLDHNSIRRVTNFYADEILGDKKKLREIGRS